MLKNQKGKENKGKIRLIYKKLTTPIKVPKVSKTFHEKRQAITPFCQAIYLRKFY